MTVCAFSLILQSPAHEMTAANPCEHKHERDWSKSKLISSKASRFVLHFFKNLILLGAVSTFTMFYTTTSFLIISHNFILIITVSYLGGENMKLGLKTLITFSVLLHI